MSKFRVETRFPLALNSQDYLSAISDNAGGTTVDNTRNPYFNQKIYDLFPGKKLWIMDLGCSGGGFVADCLKDGHQAIGLEGSDYSLQRQRAEWATIPDNLFTCDITQPFSVYYGDFLAQFDIVTAFEVMEHIRKEELPQLCRNMLIHLKTGCLWIMSVSTVGDGDIWHKTIEYQSWWESILAEFSFKNDPKFVEYFRGNFLRNDHGSFHLVLRKDV